MAIADAGLLAITGAVQGFLAKSQHIQRIDTTLKRLGVTAFLVYCCLPIPILAINAYFRVTRRQTTETYEEKKPAPVIGVKSWEKDSTVWLNSAIILASASLLIFEYVSVKYEVVRLREIVSKLTPFAIVRPSKLHKAISQRQSTDGIIRKELSMQRVCFQSYWPCTYFCWPTCLGAMLVWLS